MTQPALSIVAPVYNEARILPELIARCTRAAEQCNRPFEIVIVDDASSDETPRLLADLARDQRVRPCRLTVNAGQFRATQAGLRATRGNLVVVLDGDLQDPPEQIPRLIDALVGAVPSVMAVVAVKSHRDDPVAFMMGQYLFHRLQRLFSRVALPVGAGSYCVMRRNVASRIAMVDFARANLSAVLAVTVRESGGAIGTIQYEKGPRYDGTGRVGWRGLVAEALESLVVTGALPRLMTLAALILGAAGLLFDADRGARLLLLVGAVVAASSALYMRLHTQRALSRMHGLPARD